MLPRRRPTPLETRTVVGRCGKGEGTGQDGAVETTLAKIIPIVEPPGTGQQVVRDEAGRQRRHGRVHAVLVVRVRIRVGSARGGGRGRPSEWVRRARRASTEHRAGRRGRRREHNARVRNLAGAFGRRGALGPARGVGRRVHRGRLAIRRLRGDL